MKNLLFVLFLLPILLTAQVPIKRIGITPVQDDLKKGKKSGVGPDKIRYV